MLNLFKKKPDEQLVQMTQKCLSKVKIIEQYKTLTSKGRYEALICCAYIEMQKGSYSDAIKSKFLRHLINIRTDFGITTYSGTMVDFLNSRVQFYANEINNLLNRQGYINGKIFNAFYENPLEPIPTQSHNLPEVMNFTIHFVELIKSFH